MLTVGLSLDRRSGMPNLCPFNCLGVLKRTVLFVYTEVIIEVLPTARPERKTSAR